MSGRKSTEVAAVLKQGEAVRGLTDNIYSNQIESDFKNFRRIMSEIGKIQTQNNNIAPSLSAEAKSMFADDSEIQISDFNSACNSLKSMNINESAGENILNQLRTLDNELAAADREAQNIRDSIRGKDWYCDAEYNRAKKLVANYKQLRSQRVALQNQMTQLSKTASQQLNQAQALSNKIQKLQNNFNSMNETARKRQESNALRNDLKTSLKNISEDWAKKFFSSEYQNLKNEVDKSVADSDDNLIRNFKNIYGKLMTFKAKLEARIVEWQKQKSDAENLLADTDKLTHLGLIEPIEYYNNGENGKKIEVFDYIKKFGNNDFQTEYQKYLSIAKNNIAQENFLQAVENLNKASEIVTNARNYAVELQENMLKKTELAGAIQEVMADLNYSIDLSIINDNPNDGYKITCSIGDEVIDFDRIDIDSDGKIIVDVNHKEAVGGTCQHSWKDIAKHMLDAGIPITDVKKEGGQSVLKANKKTVSSGNVTGIAGRN